MITADMRLYDYFTIGEPNGYGQAQLPPKDAEPVGQVKLAIYSTSQATQDNVNYKDCNYIALTQAEVKDTYVIQYGKERLMVLYINPQGRYKQVFLKAL